MVTLSMPVGRDDHTMGPQNAQITLVEYGKYDCPHCLQALPILNQILRQFDGSIRFVYRHYPMEGEHSLSERAAEAAEGAGKQGKFWEMHAHLLDNQHALDDASLIAYATMLGLDTKRFADELASGAHQAAVRRQFQSGLDSGVRSTPTFFINGVRHDDFWDAETLLAAIRLSIPSR